ncbi:putative Guanidinoacetate N-methyltransferase [Aureococcus anophagefferens]|uniref:Putative Guanidinoacetate N-methyltransferase n=1 Tax=Aureococcus anophagefferens TaxID=44056 RepID=F0YQW5_AURAN|nr:putative Guanidinoacetate N-methyltransferase [Aureococcus anophagefferens]EGB02494.1 putative Guanidinoacetate N-methyltransferase [Aureococcus anophagefferens]|eukprot:XP_009042807.1 putative Guanidinoacetate N-methyltransferase [Aureococcus anophagefferens]
MAADETVYVEALARVASRPRARVLEVGFGMGISAREILRAGAAQYVVLEPNRGVFDAALGLALETAASASPFLGFWEENAPLLRSGQFDGVLYDAFPDVADSTFFAEARRLLRPGGALAFFLEGCGERSAPPTPETATRECGDWGLARSRLLDAGWLPGELKEPVPMRVSLGFEHSGARRTRTMLVTEAVRAPAGGAAAVPVPDRAALDRDLRAAAPELATRGEWQALPAAPRVDDADAGNASLIIDGAVVMDTQEAAYMVDLAGNLAGAASVLEIGYGLGLAAAAIQRLGAVDDGAGNGRDVEEHVIVEANAAVLRALLASDLGARSGVKALLGFWQEVVPLLRAESFDAVFFDPFPNDLERLGGACAHQRGFMAEAFRVLRPGGVFVYMSGSSDEASVEADTAAALAAGFLPGDVDITVRDYPMVDDLCAEYPNCAHFDHSVLMTRLVKAPA